MREVYCDQTKGVPDRNFDLTTLFSFRKGVQLNND